MRNISSGPTGGEKRASAKIAILVAMITEQFAWEVKKLDALNCGSALSSLFPCRFCFRRFSKR
jgi:hypothetical protein